MQNESAAQRVVREEYWNTLADDPARLWTPIEIQQNSPAGFAVEFDPYSESVVLFGPFHEQGVQVKTLAPWGGTFRVRGEDLLAAYANVCGRGTARDPHARALALRARLDDLPELQVPEKAAAPTREALDQFTNHDPNCQRVMSSFIGACNAVARPVTDADLQDFIQRATNDPAGAIVHYEALMRGRLGLAPAIEKPPRAKRTAQPVGKE